MKIILFLLTFLAVSRICSSQETTEAKLFEMRFNSNIYSLLMPNDMPEYTFTKKGILTFLLFATELTEEKIKALTVKQLKDLNYSNTDDTLFSLNKIIGFEDMAKELNQATEPQITERKDKYINQLLVCYSNYRNEYESKYLNHKYFFSYGRTEMGVFPSIDKPPYKNIFLFPGDSWKVNKNDYNPNSHNLKINIKVGSTQFDAYYFWDNIYVDYASTNNYKIIPTSNYSNLSGIDGNTLFGNNSPSNGVFSNTTISVKITDGNSTKSGHGGLAYLFNFRIEEIRENFFTQLFNNKGERYNQPLISIVTYENN